MTVDEINFGFWFKFLLLRHVKFVVTLNPKLSKHQSPDKAMYKCIINYLVEIFKKQTNLKTRQVIPFNDHQTRQEMNWMGSLQGF
jgi:hypothetical protein